MQRLIVFAIAFLLAIVPYILGVGLPQDQMLVLSLLIFVIVLWVTDVIPLFVTSLFIPVFLVVMGIFTPKEALAPFFDPVIVLFMSGLLIALALHKLDLDERFAWKLVSKTTNTYFLLFVLMAVTAFLSMWMSNTATTAIMLPIGVALITKLGLKCGTFPKTAVLGIAFAANIGGIGTIVGSPPNAIAVGFLSNLANIEVNFLEWMVYGVPLVVVLLPLTFLILVAIYRPTERHISPPKKKYGSLSRKQWLFLVVFLFTVLLWLSSPFHHVSSAIVALGAVLVLYVLKILDPEDLSKISWSTLLLFGGGLVLGSAIVETGLSESFLALFEITLTNQAALVMIFALIVFSVVLGAFASNTATASLLIPIMIPTASLLGLDPALIAITIGVAVSIDFLLPIGTPPNALAYATGYVSIREMLKAGILITAMAIAVLGLFAYFVW